MKSSSFAEMKERIQKGKKGFNRNSMRPKNQKDDEMEDSRESGLKSVIKKRMKKRMSGNY